MSSIGSVTFTRLDNEASLPAETLETVTRPGVSGIAVRRKGFRGGFGTLYGRQDYVNAAAMTADLATLEGYRTELVDWVDRHGVDRTNLSVQQARIVSEEQVSGAVGGTNGSNATIVATFEIVAVDMNVS